MNFYLGDDQGRHGGRRRTRGRRLGHGHARTIGARDAGSYALSAKVDEANAVIEQNDANNTYTNAVGPLVVTPVASSDLVAAAVSWSPGNPAAGQHRHLLGRTAGTRARVASAAGAHGITLTILNGSSAVVAR